MKDMLLGLYFDEAQTGFPAWHLHVNENHWTWKVTTSLNLNLVAPAYLLGQALVLQTRVSVQSPTQAAPRY